jgi:aspartate-semialdehyde dehydrogenase
MEIAIVGATGLVGRKMLSVLEKSSLKIDSLKLFASYRSAGKYLEFNGQKIIVNDIEKANYNNVDAVLFSAGASVSKKYAPLFAKNGITVVDNSSAFRNDAKIPLIVSEVNIEDAMDIKKTGGIIANPNCTTMAAMPVLSPLNKQFHLNRLIISTYQAVSGSGIKGVKELENQLEKVPAQAVNTLKDSADNIDFGKYSVYKKPIAYNAVAFAGDYATDGYTDEEIKLVNESKKILHLPNLRVTGTCVRVPVVTSHSLSIVAEFDKNVTVKLAKEVLLNSVGVSVVKLPNALEATGKYSTFVGRIRKDLSTENSLNMWVSCDNLLKGAALNAVQILENLY